MTHLRRGHWLGAALFVSLLAGVREAPAQDAIIRGKVIDDRGEALPVATVEVVELKVAILTGSDGRYTIVIPAARVSGKAATMRVRTIGHKPTTRQITLAAGDQTQDFTLQTDVNQLEAVVITGVQEATERIKVPFNVTTIDASKLPVPGADPLTELQGKIPANIVSASGRPGAQPAVLLRGPTSLNGQGRSQDPLYIVDGIVINGALPDLNPADIESYEVVKGAAASSLYGARAGNGVINITTRSGRRAGEGVQFGLRNEAGFNDIERDFGIAQRTALVMNENGTHFCEAVTGQPLCARTFDYLYWQKVINNQPTDWAGAPPSFPVDPGATISGSVLKLRFQVDPWPGQIYDAVREVVNDHPYTNNDFDMTGRFGGTRFFASASNLTQEGAIRFLQGFQRNSFRANVDQAIGAEWNVQIRTFYSRSSQDGLNQEDNGGVFGGGQSFFRLTRSPGIVNPLQYDTLGRLFIRTNLQQGGGQNENPLYYLANVDRSDITSRFLGGVTTQYTPASWIELEANFSYDLRNTDTKQFRDKGFRSTGPLPSAATNLGNLLRNSTAGEELNTGLSATFRHNFGTDLQTRYNLRYSYEQRDSNLVYGQGNTLAFRGIDALTNITANKVDSSWAQSIRQAGFFAGANLTYKERYILDGLLRRDGSSLFGPGHRWANFGRISGAVRLAQEPWWFTSKISEFKLRASYGTAGSSPGFSAQYETFGIGAGGIPQPNFLGNKDLGPEVHHELELGADIELLGRFGLTATYARSRISDQILPAPLEAASGYLQQWRNAGELLNKTWELTLNLPFVRTRDFSWTMGVSYDRNRSTITKLDVNVPPFNYGTVLQGADQIFSARPGEQVGTFYGRAFLTSCAQLPPPFNADCGPGKAFQNNDQGFLVWVGAGNNPGMGITNNLWEASLPGCVTPAGTPQAVCSFVTGSTITAPWGVQLGWGMPIILRGGGADQATGVCLTASPLATCQSAQQVPLGNALPSFRFAITQSITWKRLTVYGLLDAAIGQSVFDEGFHWAHLDFLSKDVDQSATAVATAKPIGYYYRAGPPDNNNGIGGLYDILGPNNFSVEKASYAKIRELLVSYHIGPIRGVGDWQASLVGRNLVTFTSYRGFDPEVGIGPTAGGQVNSAAINAVDSFTFPNLRTFTVGVSTSF